MPVRSGQLIAQSDLDALAAKANAKIGGGPYRFFGNWFWIPGLAPMTELTALKDVDLGDIAIPIKQSAGIGAWQLSAYPASNNANWLALADSTFGWFEFKADMVAASRRPYAVVIDEAFSALPYDRAKYAALPLAPLTGLQYGLGEGSTWIRDRGLYRYQADLDGDSISASSSGYVPIGARKAELDRMRGYIELKTRYAIPVPLSRDDGTHTNSRASPSVTRWKRAFATGGPYPIANPAFAGFFTGDIFGTDDVAFVPEQCAPLRSAKLWSQNDTGGSGVFSVRPVLGISGLALNGTVIGAVRAGINVNAQGSTGRLRGTLIFAASPTMPTDLASFTALGDTSLFTLKITNRGGYWTYDVEIDADWSGGDAQFGVRHTPTGTDRLLGSWPGNPVHFDITILASAAGGLSSKQLWSAQFPTDLPYSRQWSGAGLNEPLNGGYDPVYFMIFAGTAASYLDFRPASLQKWYLPTESGLPDEEFGVSSISFLSPEVNGLLLAKTYAPLYATGLPFKRVVFDQLCEPAVYANFYQKFTIEDGPAPFPCAVQPRTPLALNLSAEYQAASGLTPAAFLGVIDAISVGRAATDSTSSLSFEIGAFGILGTASDHFTVLFSGSLAANQKSRTWRPGDDGFDFIPVLSPIPLAYRCAQLLIIQPAFWPALNAADINGKDGQPSPPISTKWSSYANQAYYQVGHVGLPDNFFPPNQNSLAHDRDSIRAIHYNEIERLLDALP